MPRCRDGLYCIDDLCHMTEQTLCGLYVDEAYEAGDDEEWGEDYEDMTYEGDPR